MLHCNLQINLLIIDQLTSSFEQTIKLKKTTRGRKEDAVNIGQNKTDKYERKDAWVDLVKKKPAETGLILAL